MLSQVLSVLVQYNCTAPRIACAVLNKVGIVQSSFLIIQHSPSAGAIQLYSPTGCHAGHTIICTAPPHISTLPSGVPNKCSTSIHAYAACQRTTLASELATQLPNTTGTLGGRVASDVCPAPNAARQHRYSQPQRARMSASNMGGLRLRAPVVILRTCRMLLASLQVMLSGSCLAG